MKTLLFVFGTRPEAVKMAPLIWKARTSEAWKTVVCVTGQHREMLDQILSLFDIQPDFDLQLMQENQSLASLTARVVEAVDRVIRDVRPDWVLVQGDTTTTMGAALAAFYQNIPVGHVEAGLRTWNLAAPFPEEMNRQVVSRVASLHFAPTQRARENLLREGVPENRIWVTGNTVIDALLWIREVLLPQHNELLQAHGIKVGEGVVLLVTGHRRENFGEGMRNICQALAELARRHPDWAIVYPVHLNPNVQRPVKALLGEYPNISLLPPLPYDAFVALMDRADLILTDSGGIQEEAPSLGKPVLVMRETTERTEAIEAGVAKLVGTRAQEIVSAVEHLLKEPSAYYRMADAPNPFGDGHASERILRVLSSCSPCF